MAFGLGVLRLSPSAFWAASPRELVAAAIGVAGRLPAEPISRGALQSLMAAFPDEG